jgi:hypothetical protein
MWCLTGCQIYSGFSDYRTFDDLPVIEFEVTEVTVRPTIGANTYILSIYMRRVTGGGREYSFYSDQKCANQIQGDILVTVNEKLPNGLYLPIDGGGGGGYVSRAF